MMMISRNNESSRVCGHDDALAYLNAVKVAFQYNMITYDQILNLTKLLLAGRIYIYTSPEKYDQFLNCIKERVKELLKGHIDLILGFNIFLPERHQITLPFQLETTGKKVKKLEESFELPLDVLDTIFKTLDFNDLFQFACVCKNWRGFHNIFWRNFLESQEPLLLQLSYHDGELHSFISIPDQKVYHLEMMKNFPYSTYVASSSGYFIKVGFFSKSFMLINPFNRIKKIINRPSFSSYVTNRALLAFGKCSEEFVLVVLCKCCLHVYQSRYCDWITYSTTENSGSVVDFVVLHNILYVVTDMANIGVLSLNSANVKFLKLKNTPNATFSSSLKLVNCDEQLLVVDFMFNEIRSVYKIDFSTMNYVKLETLGDIALFCGSNGLKRNCYALSNPYRWGYESNSVYVIRLLSTICSVYSGDDKKLQKCITLPASETRCFMVDWCFRHLKYEVDYSLVE